MSAKDFDGMTAEEIREWDQEQRARARAKFAGQPVPAISRAKRDDYPHWERSGWGFRLHAGAKISVASDDGSETEGRVLGLREVLDRGPLALVVDLDGPWALRRAGGEIWAEQAEADRVTVPEPEVPVTAWKLAEPPAPGVPVEPAARAAHEWTVRTNHLEGQA
jgi:hypothetical protein